MTNLVFCADGTWNHPSLPKNPRPGDPTNVFKLFIRLPGDNIPASTRLADEQEIQHNGQDGTRRQWAKYIHGVGDSDNALVSMLGGATGAGLINRVVRGYTYISRNYRDGDKIFLIGFSRGAYTVRALASLILHMGLLDRATYDPSDTKNAYKLGAAAWYQHQRSIKTDGVLGALNKLVEDLPGFLVAGQPKFTDPAKPINIQAIGVWDTVASFGFIPTFDAHGARTDLFPLADAELSSRVAFGFHAVARDEQRNQFRPVLWNERTGIAQTIFIGSHADTGGGYPLQNRESNVSDIGLEWMIERLTTAGMIIDPAGTGADSIPSAPDSLGPAHQQWRYPPWSFDGHTPRNLYASHGVPLPNLSQHTSVAERLNTPGSFIQDPGDPTKGLEPFVGSYI